MSSSLWGGGIGRAYRVNDDAGDGSWVAEAVGQRDTLIARCGCWRQAARARITWQRRGAASQICSMRSAEDWLCCPGAASERDRPLVGRPWRLLRVRLYS